MSYIPLLGLPAPSLFGRSIEEKKRLLDESGFRGMELFMFPGAAKDLCKHREVMGDTRLSLHQPWSYQESGGHWINAVLGRIGHLPKDGYSLEELLKDADGELFVAYANYIDEVQDIAAKGTTKVDWAFQTATTWDRVGHARKNCMSYDVFLRRVHNEQLSIVFDTFHVLEWKLNDPSMRRALTSMGERELSSLLLATWHEIGPERIAEIHWNDCSGKGHEGRCLPGDGKLLLGLRQLAREIKQTGWRRFIVPEVSPFALFPNALERLIDLRYRMEYFFV